LVGYLPRHIGLAGTPLLRRPPTAAGWFGVISTKLTPKPIGWFGVISTKLTPKPIGWFGVISTKLWQKNHNWQDGRGRQSFPPVNITAVIFAAGLAVI
jgi:hypothetical protein